MKTQQRLANLLSKGNKDKNQSRWLYLVMQKVGGYEQLLNLPLPALNEILECMEWEANEKIKGAK